MRKILIAAGAAAVFAMFGFRIGYTLGIEPGIIGAIGAVLGASSAYFLCQRI